MASGGLFAVMDFTGVPEDEFHDWYDGEHLPERRGIPGFVTCERWIGADNPKISVGSYDLTSTAVLLDAPYRAVSGDNASERTKRITGMCRRMMRVFGDQIIPGDQLAPAQAGGMLLNAFNIAPEYEADFLDWSKSEHLPRLAAVPGALSARLFRSDDGSHRYIAVYHLASADVQASPAWRAAAGGPWTAKLLPHFRDRLRIPCCAYVPAARTSAGV